MIDAILLTLLVIFIYMTSWFLVALWKKRNDVVDIAWGLGFVLVAWVLWFVYQPSTVHSLMLLGVITIWGVRLAWHIGQRWLRSPQEDYRYAQWRAEWGKWVIPRSFFQVFMLQGAILLIVSLPSLIAMTDMSSTPLQWWNGVGLSIWCIGFFFEAVGDYQLGQFVKKKKPGQIMTTGLWKYTRHPNYFGEVTQWWGIWLLVSGLSGWIWAVLSPLTISYLILKVSGIPLLEKKYEGNKDFEEYRSRTSAFFPWIPKDH